MLKIEFKKPQKVFGRDLHDSVLANDATLDYVKDIQLVVIDVSYKKWPLILDIKLIKSIKNFK